MANLPDTKSKSVAIKEIMNKAGNQRSKTTQDAIEKAVFTLLKRQGYDAFSVRDVCTEAGINRSSFYAHYQDINDLMIKIEGNLVQRVQETLISPINTGTNHFDDYFVNFFNFVKEIEFSIKRFLAQQMFRVAFNNRLVEFDSTQNFIQPKRVSKVQKKALTQEQEKIFVDACLKDLDKYEPLLICCLQGMRKGEMLALRPNDFDFEKNTLRIDESFDENYPTDLETKNQESKRTMPMFSLTQQVLAKYKDLDPTKRIYENHRSSVLSKRLDALCLKNGLPRITIHELRHTFTRCHDKKIDEIVIQKWVGHAKGSRMTKAIYTHVTDDAELRYIDVFNGKNDTEKSA